MLGQQLKHARTKAGLTQEELAARAKISREYVSKLECNKQSPTIDMLFRLTRILGVSASSIIAAVERSKTSRTRRG
jgi:transcriptional regulator with XRE-family HTH domain